LLEAQELHVLLFMSVNIVVRDSRDIRFISSFIVSCDAYFPLRSSSQPPLRKTRGVSQCRVKLLLSHYFKHATSSSAAEVLFQSPAYLEIYRARRTPFGEIWRLHMSRLRGLKIPTMLCAQTNFPKSVAEDVRDGASHMTHTCTLASVFHSLFSECQEVFLPRF